jgi:transposase InsO family protein
VGDQAIALRASPFEQLSTPVAAPYRHLLIDVLRRPVEFAQFTSWAFTRRAVDSGLLPSMGSVGDCYDNAMMGSFWSRVQVELLDRKRWSTRIELASAIFEYLEIFHNRQRRHSALSMLTPLEFEARHQPTTAA